MSTPTRESLHVAAAVFRRSMTLTFKNPALLVPALLFPVVFLLAFAGGLSRVGDVPGFAFPSGYTAFQFVFVALQSAAFGGIFTGFGIAADFETGFARRLLLGAPVHGGIVLGYLASGLARFAFTGTLVTAGALIAGMQVGGGAVDLLGLLGLALLFNASATLFAIGFAMRTKTLQAAPGMQIPMFLSMFLAPVFVPLELLTGWIHSAAGVNPVTALMEAARGFIAGEPNHAGLAFAVVFGLLGLFSIWAVRGLRRVERGL